MSDELISHDMYHFLFRDFETKMGFHALILEQYLNSYNVIPWNEI